MRSGAKTIGCGLLLVALAVPSPAQAFPESWWRFLNRASTDTGVVDTGADAGVDTGVEDSGEEPDLGYPPDSGEPEDTGVPPDTGEEPDTGADSGADSGVGDVGFDPLPLSSRLIVMLGPQSNNGVTGSATALSTGDAGSLRYYDGGGYVMLNENSAGTWGYNGETPATQACRYVSAYDDAGPRVCEVNTGFQQDGLAYSSFARGTARYDAGLFNLAQHTALHNSTYPGVPVYPVAHLLQGETDELNGRTAEQYAADMATLQTDLSTDWPAIAGSTDPSVPLIMWQLPCWTQLQTPPLEYSEIAQGQYLAARDNDGIMLAGPGWVAPYFLTTDFHLSNVGKCIAGAYFGKADLAYINRQKFQPLHPVSVVGTGPAEITITLAGNVGTVAADTTTVLGKPWYGFEYRDTQTDVPTITGITINGAATPPTIVLTLNRNWASGGVVQYALRSIRGAGCGPTASLGAPGGNIRDSDPATATCSGTVNLYNWLVGFEEAVTGTPGSASAATTWANTGSVDCPGAGRWMTAGTDAALDGAANATWAWWQRSNSTWSGTQILFARNRAGYRQFDFRMSGTTLQAYMATDINTIGSATTLTGWTSSVWQHVCITKSGTAGTIYRNGVSGATPTWPATLTTPTGSDLEVCSTSIGVSPANANMRDVAIWDSVEDCTLIYNGGVPADLRSLAGVGAPERYWPLNTTFEDLGTATPPENLRPYGVGIAFENGVNP